MMPSDVRSTVSSLEWSPSKDSESSKPTVNKGAKAKTPAADSGHWKGKANAGHEKEPHFKGGK
jgi:hypothetical protein